MQLDGLLAFLDGPVEVRLSQTAAFAIANGVQRYHLGEVVLVTVLLFKRTFDVRYRTVIISIVPCGKRMPPTALRSVLLRRATYGRHDDDDGHDGYYMSCGFGAHASVK